MTTIFGILGLGLLMIVHESGHYLAARAFHMRVTRFSIGFGPALFRHTPKGSPTTYQVAIIPLLAYVQIAGMNPLEDIDPKDEGSYANASLIGRVVTIFSGPLANYLFASVLFFASMLVSGQGAPTTSVEVLPAGAAAAAQMKSGDKVVEVAGKTITDWSQMRNLIASYPDKTIDVVVEREGQLLHFPVTPKVDHGEGRIGVQTIPKPLTVGDAARYAVKQPAELTAETVVGIGRMLTGRQKPDLAGPVGIIRETTNAAKAGLAQYLFLLGLISTSLAVFNLLPIPALDGGRLMFLAYEATTRRRPNPKVEAQVNAVGLLMMLALVVVVTFVVDLPNRH
jgi:regulator of sigma E protease